MGCMLSCRRQAARIVARGVTLAAGAGGSREEAGASRLGGGDCAQIRAMQRRASVDLGTCARRGVIASRTRRVEPMSRRRPKSAKTRCSHANPSRQQTTPKMQTPTVIATTSSEGAVRDAVASVEDGEALLTAGTGVPATPSTWDIARIPPISKRTAMATVMSFVIGRAVVPAVVACVSGIPTMAGKLYQPGGGRSVRPGGCRCARLAGT